MTLKPLKQISPRLIKVLRDLTANKSRTLLVILSIAVGIYAIAATLGARQVLMREFEEGFEESKKFSISYTLNEESTRVEGVLRQIDSRDDVLGVSGRRVVAATFIQVPAYMSEAEALSTLSDSDEDRTILSLQAAPDSEFTSGADVNHFFSLEHRVWPPGPQDIIIEASALQVYDLRIGDRLFVEVGSDKAIFRIAGFAHDINAIPTMFFSQVEAFVSMSALAQLNLPEEPNRVMVRVDPELSRVEVASIAENIQSQHLDSADIIVDRMEVPEPNFHFFGSLFEAVSVLLLFMAFMALALSGFLVVTTTNAILIQQTRQLGIMKAIGGMRRQISTLYFGLVAGYGILALFIGIPTGILFGHAFINYAAGVLNFHVTSMAYPAWVIALLVAVGILLPVLAAWLPIQKGVRRPIVEVLSSYANTVGFGKGWVDRLLGKVSFLPRPTALALRSTFSRKGRLVLTLTTLLLASGVVMSVFSAHASLGHTVDMIGGWWKYDTQVRFAAPVNNEDLKRVAYDNDEVIYAETWLDTRATIVRPDGTKNDSFWALGVPPETRILDFDFEYGRAPEPGEQGIIIDTELFVTEDYLEPPATVELIIGGQEVERPVVGVVTGSLQGAHLYMDRDDLADLMGISGASTRVLVQAQGGQYSQPNFRAVQERLGLQTRLAESLDRNFTNQNHRVISTQTAAEQLQTQREQLDILSTFLIIMASALAVVGVIGLSGSMTLSVIESTREIGIMRSVGASHLSIFGIYITQGLVVGTISWFFGVFLSWPLSYVLMMALSMTLEMRLAYLFSFEGVVIWLVFVWVISILASLLPAWRASQVSIRDAISHE
ncbi:MAG: ABC transporter permease [Coriobacteriia bacterium]|nr:ABC transporter permease [Coriobacteriia bacterium]